MTSSIQHDLTGRRFGRLIVKERAGPASGHGRAVFWLTKCDCGNTRAVRRESLFNGNTRSCGCLRRELRTVHGQTTPNAKNRAEYRIWASMIQRCINPLDKSFKNYGGRGIKVCQRWRDSFQVFFSDIGPRPSHELTIDRINNDGDYEPGNVRWATRSQQNLNQRKRKPREWVA